MGYIVLLIVAWGAFAFGAVYPWAYWPLAGAAALAGLWGFLRKVPRVRKRVNAPVATGIVLLAAAIGVQLVPVARQTILDYSPAADEVLRNYDLDYSLKALVASSPGLSALANATAPTSHSDLASRPDSATALAAKPQFPAPTQPGTSPPPTQPGASPPPTQPGTSPAPTQPGTSPAPTPPGTPPAPTPPGTSPAPTQPHTTALAPIPAPATSDLTHPLSINPSHTQLGLALFLAFSILLLGLARGLDGTELRTFAFGITALGVAMALVAIVQKALWNGKVYGFWEPVNEGAGAFGPFINRNHFAGWMLLALPITIALFSSQVAKGMRGVRPTWRDRLMWFSTRDANRVVLTGFAMLVMGLALVMTLSRSGVSCFAVALLLSGIQVMRRQTTTSKRRTMVTYLVLVAAVSVTWAGIDAIAARFAQVDWELGGRAGAWTDALRIHNLFPTVGTGLNTYGTATLFYQTFEATSAHYVEAHNDYLQLLAEGGYLLLIPAVLLVVLFANEVRKRFESGNDDPTGYWLRIGAVTGLVAIALQEVVEFSLQMPGNVVLFVTVCAIAMRKTSQRGIESTGHNSDHRDPHNHESPIAASRRGPRGSLHRSRS